MLGLLATGVVVTSCKKTEVREIHENLVITGNTPPPYNGVTELQVSNYVNRLYIDLVGEQPTDNTLNYHVAFLQNNDLSDSARTVLVDSLLTTQDYFERFFILTSGAMLNGIDKAEINNQLLTLQAAADLYYQSGDSVLGQFFDFEIVKLNDLLVADSALMVGDIDINEYYRRFIWNSVYDEVNMGSENFVVACFENLFNRLPTEAELASGVAMVDGQANVILLMDGDSKLDFINIVTTVDEFYQGLVLDTYLSFLLRDPSSSEMTNESMSLSVSGDLKALQTTLLISDEYAGF